MKTTQTPPSDGEWMHLREAIFATGVGERTLQRWADEGKVQRDNRGYGQVHYFITSDKRKDRRDESQIVGLLREEKADSLEKIGLVSEALERTTKALQGRLQGLEESLSRATQIADRRGKVGGFLLATSVALGVGLVAVLITLETERETGRRLAESLRDAEVAQNLAEADSKELQAKLQKANSPTSPTSVLERIAFALGVDGKAEPDIADIGRGSRNAP